MHRRSTLKHLLFLPAVSYLKAKGEIQGAKKLRQFGLQLSTITPMMATDFAGTIKQVADIGYRMVEFSALGFLGHAVAEVKDLLLKYDLSAPVGRVAFKMDPGFMVLSREEQIKSFGNQSSMESLQERIRTSLAECKVMGQKILIIPAIMPHIFSDMQQIKNMIEVLKDCSKFCSDQGITLGYHNHDWEFAEVDGKIPYEIMMQELDPGLFTFQLDTYWIRKAGLDLTDLLTRHAGRFVTCHFKDIDENGDFEDVGYGQIDFSTFTRQAVKQGAKYFFVERDTSMDPLDSIKKSYAYLEKMRY